MWSVKDRLTISLGLDLCGWGCWWSLFRHFVDVLVWLELLGRSIRGIVVVNKEEKIEERKLDVGWRDIRRGDGSTINVGFDSVDRHSWL
jgi:hypothetical protein